MEQQLNLFEEQGNTVSSFIQHPSSEGVAVVDRMNVVTALEEPQAPPIELEADTVSIDENTPQNKLAYEEGDIVKLNIPSEEEDSEIHWWIQYYFSHLKNAKGRVIRVLPYSRLQYEIEFDVKHEDKCITMYHEHLTWISS